MRIVLILIFFMTQTISNAQQADLKWWNPQSNKGHFVEGQGWETGPLNYYGRLPQKAQQQVRPIIWSKSQQTTGLLVRFKTNASRISVRYQVKQDLAFEHMPATGVTGIDLYGLDSGNGWRWPGFTYVFGDTVQYFFDSLQSGRIKEYYLYLPLYNQLKWMEIGVPANNTFVPLVARQDPPVVVYGTSIVQGGCASRPGMAWTAILSRKLKCPLINLGFSGNGLLEEPIIHLLCEVDAAVYILDCLPNLTGYREEEIVKKIVYAVTTIRKVKPNTPIVLAEHGDANIGLLDGRLHDLFQKVNRAGNIAYKQLLQRNIKGVFFLTSKQIGLDVDATVDGQHPNDLGMMKYANAYYQIVSPLIKK